MVSKHFFRAPATAEPQSDARRAAISIEAFNWIKENWRKFKSPTALYNSLKEKATTNIWIIPSKSWFYRRWQEIPQVIKVFHLEGKDAYQSKLASYVPRDLNDLTALQVLCGDHREGDVTVYLANGKLVRVWLTYWLDLRTSLIWGWYLSLTPNSEAIALAYADGIAKFGAQPFSRPEDGFYSYIYTDRGKSYRSHDIEGNVILIHERAADISDKFEYLLVERKIGLVEDFRIKQLLAKVRNPKEKQIERTNKDFSEWEKNNLVGYCGNKPSERPDQWSQLFDKHHKLSKDEIHNSPFLSFDEYKTKIAGQIEKHNSTAHQRINLGGKWVVPIKEYQALYTTRYEIPQELVTTLLLKTKSGKIGKNGVNCFRKNWFYWHPEMSDFKGLRVQIKYTDQDYKTVWVVLPDKRCVEAALIEPSSILNPNKETLKQIKKIDAQEKENIKNFHLLQHSKLRFETTEERLIKSIPAETSVAETTFPKTASTATVHLFPSISKVKTLNKLNNQSKKSISAQQVRQTKAEIEILPEVKPKKIKEFE
ncbi:MAG: hypothetical protein HC846_01375 [Blastocatellia bacterium]|nr:hypothetical protein [Blastocatellia bacterium]